MIRLALSAALAISVVSPPICAQSPGGKDQRWPELPRTQSVPPCQTLSGASSGEPVVSSFIPGPSYVEEPIEQLKKTVPHLDPIEIGASQDAGQASLRIHGYRLRDETDFVLSRTGAAITDLFRRMPNLIAREEVQRSAPHLVGYDVRYFNYVIAREKKPTGGDVIVEFRTNANGQPIDNSVRDPNRPLGIGFATIWLAFLPQNLHESHFRYLGRQSIGRRKTHVMAFAENPEDVGLQTVISYSFGQCSAPLQGIAWIDQSTFQILRMQTDLLYSLPDIQMYQLRSVLSFGPVKIAGLNLSLWMPKVVETTWQTAFRAEKESHRYSHYRLFQANVRILPGFKRQRK